MHKNKVIYCILATIILCVSQQAFMRSESEVTHYKKLITWNTDIGTISALAWNSDSQLLAAISLSGILQIWDGSTDHILNTMQVYSGPLRSLDWHPGAPSTLATGGNDGTIRIWDAETGKENCIFMGHDRTLSPGEGNPDGVAIVKWSPDGKLIASGGYDGTVRLWDTTSATKCNLLQPLVIPAIHPSAMQHIDWNPTSDALLSTGSFNELPIWDAKSGKKLDAIPCPLPYSENDPCTFATADWSSDGKYVIASGESNSVGFSSVWDVATKESRDLISMCTSSLTWMPHSYALIGWCEGQFQIWDAENLQPIGITELAEDFEKEGNLLLASAISPDEQRIAVSYQTETNMIIQVLSAAE
jgi:eukaryotic-like serine/threonine-protein kinase